MATLEERVALLEQQQALQSQALRAIVEGNWTDTMPHAAALIVALMGGQAPVDFEPVAFPKPSPPATPPEQTWWPMDVRGSLPTNNEASYGSRDLSGITGVVLHYTAGPGSQTVQAVAAYQTSDAARGQTGNGTPFPGLAYHIFVEADGKGYLAHDLTTRVWHSAAPGRNTRYVGICYAGNVGPTVDQIVTMGRAIGWLQKQLGRNLTVEGHGDAYSTSCPGPTWPSWKQRVLDEVR